MTKRRYLELFCVGCGVCLYSAAANAQLSANPWAEANDDEAIEEVYNRRQRRGYTAPTEYQREESVVIDRTHAYIQEDEVEEDKSFVEKVKDAFSGKKEEEKPLITNTADNRKALAKKKAREQAQKAEENEDDSGSLLPSFGMGKLGGFKMPSFNATSLIKKFERASGVDLKSIGKQFK